MQTTAADLHDHVTRLNGQGYRSYKALVGSYAFDTFTLHIDHVQGDPFAAPSRVRARVSQSVAQIPRELFRDPVRRMAIEDFLARAVSAAVTRIARGQRGSGRGGAIEICSGAQEVIERTALVVCDDWVEARMQVGLPAEGRSILGYDAAAMLCNEIPAVVAEGLLWRNADQPAAQRFVGTVENYHAIRERLDGHGLVAFVADGSVLPRESGASDLPLAREDSVAFASCDPYRIMMPIPNEVSGTPGGPSSITGLGIRQGVTLIVGGGYHGKSTLLKALERGVYPHVPGDGREYVVTDPRAVKIRAEDGRRVERVDISAFIDNLPHGRDTAAFCTDDASGSTSQAANILEAIEAGATTLLLDEDTCATNFMVRDARMQALVAKENEPITPFIDRVRELYDTAGVSTVLVMGGCGDYFDVADTVFQMNRYAPSDATEAARRVAQSHPTGRQVEAASALKRGRYRIPDPSTLDPSRGHREVKIDADGVDVLRFGHHRIDLHHIDQLVDRLQTLAIGRALVLARNLCMKSKPDVNTLLDHIESALDESGLDALDPSEKPGTHPGCFARPRRFEIVAALNRLRTLHVEVK